MMVVSVAGDAVVSLVHECEPAWQRGAKDMPGTVDCCR